MNRKYAEKLVRSMKILEEKAPQLKSAFGLILSIVIITMFYPNHFIRPFEFDFLNMSYLDLWTLSMLFSLLYYFGIVFCDTIFSLPMFVYNLYDYIKDKKVKKNDL